MSNLETKNEFQRNNRDPLTGAYSHSYFKMRLVDELQLAEALGNELSVCIMDLDYFKSINDGYGHLRGDQVLQEFVQSIQSIIRSGDSLYRYGGDEFVLILPGTGKERSLQIAQRIVQTIKDHVFPGEPPLFVSLSIGVASFPEDAETPEKLFATADRHMYAAKHQGRCQAAGSAGSVKTNIDSEASRLIERDGETAKIRRFLERLSEERSGVLAFCGASGSGLTRMLEEASGNACRRGFDVIMLTATPDLKKKAYGILATVDHPLLPPPTGDLSVYYEKFRERLGSESKRVLIAVDDLGSLDYATWQLIIYLFEKRETFCLGLAYTVREEHPDALPMPRNHLFETAVLQPLTPVGIRMWIRNSLHWDPDEILLDRLCRETQGYPGKIRGLLSQLMDAEKLVKTGEHEWIYLEDDRCHGNDDGMFLMPPHNLPVPLTEFVGREKELRDIHHLLDHHRLVTLTGPGGIGKTRLSITIGSMRLNRYPDGVRLVQLASIDRPQLVEQCIAKSMGIWDRDRQATMNSLKTVLQNKKMLLILDNFEHVIDAAPIVSELLAFAPEVRTLVTSREALRLNGEHIYDVPPLHVPAIEPGLPIGSLSHQGAVTLFSIRAKAIRYDFELNETNVDDVTSICRNLDGIPLAIELAAAQVGRLSLHDMVTKSQNTLQWLDQGARDLPDRQQTLKKTMEWSYQLLTKGERALFGRLGVFSDGFDVDAAHAVCPDVSISRQRLEEQLRSLSEKSLLKTMSGNGGSGETRFGMLETIREFALENLVFSGDEWVCRKRHAGYFLDLAERAAVHLTGAERGSWLTGLEREHANFRSALNWAFKEEDTEMLSRLAEAMGSFWELQGFWEEGCLTLGKILERYANAVPPERKAKLLFWLGRLACISGDLKTARRMLQEGYNVSRESEDLKGMARLLSELGIVANCRWDLRGAKRYFEHSLALYQSLGDEAGVAMVYRELGSAFFYHAEYRQAEEFLLDSLVQSRKLDDPFGVVQCLNLLGKLARAKGEYHRAAELFQENLAICESLEFRKGIIDSLLNLAELARSRGDYDNAVFFYQRLLAICRTIGNKSGIARALKDLGEVARLQGDAKRAMTLYGECLPLVFGIGDNNELVWVFRNMGEVALSLGEIDRAKALFDKALGVFRTKTDKLLMTLIISGLAGVAFACGEHVRAARLLGVSEKLLVVIGSLIAEGDRRLHEERKALIRASMEEEQFIPAFNEGTGMGEERAVEYALEFY